MKRDLRHHGSQTIDPDGVPVGAPGRSRASRFRGEPVRLQWRQVAPIHAGDTGEMQEKWVTRKRYARWDTAYDAMWREARRHPWAEWRLIEDLLPRVGSRGPRPGQLRWSQICRHCQSWGVHPPEPGSPAPPDCLRCGAPAAPVDSETTIGPARVLPDHATQVAPNLSPINLLPPPAPPPASIAWAWPARRARRHKRHPDYAHYGLRRDR